MTMTCLESGSALYEALAKLVEADSEPRFLAGVERQLLASTALRTARRLKHIPFLEWADGPRKAWLHSQATITKEIEPASLLAQLQDMGILMVNTVEGRNIVSYDFAALLVLSNSGLVRQDWPQVIDLLASAAPPFRAKIHCEQLPANGKIHADLMAKAEELGLRIVIQQQEVLCWLCISALTMHVQEGIAEKLSAKFQRRIETFGCFLQENCQ